MLFDFVSQKKILDPILKDPKNHVCADCDTISPTWASLDFGVFLCSNCSGAHRGLGPTITRVRSANLDIWQREWVNNMQIGNAELNNYWEEDLKALQRKPKMGASLEQIGRYVYQKYVKRKFVKDNSVADPLTAFKNGTYEKPAPSVEALSKENKNKADHKQTAKKSADISKQTSVPKNEVNLLDDIQLNQPSVTLPFQKKQPNVQVVPSQSTHPIAVAQQDDQFTSYTQAGTSFTAESKDNFINFQTLMNQQMQTQAINPPNNNSFNGIKHQNMNIHHPYNPTIGQRNLVYNAHFQPSYQQAPQYPYHNNHQVNMGHSYSPQMHNAANYGMGYPNQSLIGNVNQYWK